MSTEEGKEIISNSWKEAGIFDAILLGSSQFPPLDTFNDVCSMLDNLVLNETLSLASLFPQEIDSYRGCLGDNDDENESDWEDNDNGTKIFEQSEEGHEENIFDIFDK